MNKEAFNTGEKWSLLLFPNGNSNIEVTQSVIETFTAKAKAYSRQLIEFSEIIESGIAKMPDFVALVPLVLEQMQLSVKSFENICHSCIIFETELYSVKQYVFIKLIEPTKDSDANLEKFQGFWSELVYAIPHIFKQLNFEVYRSDEQVFVNEKMLLKLARAIHARYQRSMTDLAANPENAKIYTDLYLISDASKKYIASDFDSLPENIQQSNIENVRQIPSKLLAIGYTIREKQPGENVPLLYLSETDIETMAMVEHDRWMSEKRLNGFRYAPVRDDSKKLHPCLIPFNELSELEKEKDRVLVKIIPPLLQDIGYVPVPISPEMAINVHYPLQAKAKILTVKQEAESLLSDIESFTNLNKLELPVEIRQKIKSIIADTGEIGEGISAAGTIQRTYLPVSLYFRECLPESFLLYKPKDIVSGDFYFVSRKQGSVVFVAADCTGHGIQGGMLTAICYNFIDQAVNDKNITDPAAIIDWVMPRVENMMRRYEGNIENKSGMELAVCTLYPQANILFYAGLNRPLLYFTDNQLCEAECTKFRDSYEASKNALKTQILQLKEGDTIYLFSDGFADQFGGSKSEIGEKFKMKRFKELLQSVQQLDMTSQREALNQTIEKWRQDGKQEQTDDIIVIGVKM